MMRHKSGFALIAVVGMLTACGAQGIDATAGESTTSPLSTSSPATSAPPTTVTPGGGDKSDWTSEQLTWSGAGALNIAGTDGGTVSTADAADYTGINCPGISLG